LPLSDPSTLRGLLDAGRGDAPSILSPGRAPLSFDSLRSLVDRTSLALANAGVGRSQRLALVLPNGPEMAACFLAVACHATAAPLNPAFRTEEFRFYLADLGATTLVVERGVQTPAVATARELGIRVIELIPDPAGPAGMFQLQLEEKRHPTPQGPHRGRQRDRPQPQSEGQPDPTAAQSAASPSPEDIALLLHTSGTTSRPKLVPLSHRNLCASAANVSQTLRLDAGDCCLNVMPLFHIHGLVAALLASLCAGGAVCASPGFDALRFFSWFEESRPTWYTAVPTMHQAIMHRARRNRRIVNSSRLRFIRSASAPLPKQVLFELEDVFSVPVVEAYAMTEAAHQMTSNPLPPGKRRPGSVGQSAGPEVAVMDETSERLLPTGETGEVVIRGENVMTGYENNPDANVTAFAGGWFRTGDQAIMDADGYLTLTGRLKEIINRGGEKISPVEIDAVLMDHPAVSQAVTFAVPHRSLGEAVAAAVVLHQGVDSDPEEIRRFTGARLAAYKVPHRIVVLDEIPKGATGKLQRVGLAARLGLA